MTMGSSRIFFLCIGFLCSCWTTQGFYTPDVMESGSSFLPHNNWHGMQFEHGLVVSRGAMSTVSIPQPIQMLHDKVLAASDHSVNGGSTLEETMTDISWLAEGILQQSGVIVQEQDIQKIISETIKESVPQLPGVTDYQSPRLQFALALLQALGDKVLTDPSTMYQTVGAIQETAVGIVIVHALENMRPVRETTVGAHAETGPHGHSGGISASHTTSGGTSYGGHIDHGPGGTSGGLSASHTWSHGDGSKTSLGGYVDHSHWGGTSGGISVSHTFG